MKRLLVLISALISATALCAQAPDSALLVSGGSTLHLGTDAAVFGPAAAGRVDASFALIPSLPLSLEGGVGYSTAQLSGSAATSLRTFTAAAGASYRLLRLGVFDLSVRASVGVYIASLSDGSGSALNPALEAGIAAAARLGSLTPFIRASYVNRLGLAQGVDIGAGLVFPLGDDAETAAARRRGIEPPQMDVGGASIVPLGSDAGVFSPGFGGKATLSYPLGLAFPLAAEAAFGYTASTLAGNAAIAMTVSDLSAGLSYRLLRFGPFDLSVRASGGGYFAALSDGSGTAYNPLVDAGVAFAARLGACTPFIRASYAMRLGLSSGIDVAAGLSIPLGTGEAALKARSGGIQLLELDVGGASTLPIGTDAGVFAPGFGGKLVMDFPLGLGPPLSLETGLGFTSSALKGDAAVTMAVSDLSAGLSFRLLRAGPFDLALRAAGGGYFAALSDGSGTALNPAFDAGVAFSARLGSLSPFIRVSYAMRLGLSSGVDIGAGLVIPFGARQAGAGTIPTEMPKEPARPKPLPSPKEQPKLKILKAGPGGLEVIGLEIESLFPVFFRFYDTHQLGYLVIRNTSRSALENFEAVLLIKQFMDNPKECPGPAKLEAGAEARIPLFALFTDKILGVSEGNKVSGSIAITYKSGGREQKVELTTAVNLYDRNATTWDDDRRAAAFVTAKDPLVLRFSKNLAGFMEDAHKYSLPKPFAAALGVFESLRRYGMRYVIDPNSSYETVSKAKTVVDFIQFPRQTLDFKAGDCDDLSVLSAALLESIGAKAAFVTVPGHIYAAVDLELSPDQARKSFVADQIIIQGDRAWLPFEVTALGDDFLKAWDLGAKEWREAKAKNLAALYPVADAWTTYPPVGFVSETAQAQPPDATTLSAACLKLMERYIERKLAPAVAKLESDMKRDGRAPKSLNRLGVLYGSSGLIDQANAAFKEAAAKDEYAPALMNLGNIAFLQKRFDEALGFYERALAKTPKDAKALLAVARANHELENYGQVKTYYARLKTADAKIASQFSYLELRGDEAGRAASATGVKEVVIWSE